VLKTVVLLNVFIETMVHFYSKEHSKKCWVVLTQFWVKYWVKLKHWVKM